MCMRVLEIIIQRIKPISHFHFIELKINLPMFYRYNNFEEYLGWEMKVEELFEFHQV